MAEKVGEEGEDVLVFLKGLGKIRVLMLVFSSHDSSRLTNQDANVFEDHFVGCWLSIERGEMIEMVH